MGRLLAMMICLNVVKYDGVRFVDLEFLRKWKSWRGREKDVQDVKLIDEWRANNE